MKHTKLPNSLTNREQFILNQAKGKDVLHLGCSDFPFTELRIKENSWLHAKILNVAKSCIGVDLNETSIKTLKNRYGIKEIYVGDAEHLERIKNKKFDLIIAGEIIEHLNNPGLLLKSSKGLLKSDGKLLLTTTNAFCLRRFIRIPFGYESIHPDHVYYFSHTTLGTLATRFGYRLVYATSYRIPNRKPLIPFLVEKLATLISSNFGEGIIHLYSLK